MNMSARATLIDSMARRLDAIGGPVRVSRAEGVRLFDESGRSWTDCETGNGLFSLGHRHPGIMGAFDRAMARVDLGNHHLISGERAQLAADLGAAIGAGRMRCVFNVSSGESIDCAIKLARGVTGKSSIVCADNAYHGCSGYALAASAPRFTEDLPCRLPGFVHVAYGSIDAMERELAAHADAAAVLVEPMAIEAGCVAPPEGFLGRVSELCRERGALLIVDESVTGLGRTGHAFAFTQQGAVPDILAAGHALGGGVYPVYAACHREELDSFYVRSPFVHVSTFGGGEVGCAAARTALDELSRDSLLENVRLRGAEFRSGVSALRGGDGASVCAVRGAGLANAVEFRDEAAARAAQRALFDRGVLCRPALLAPQTLLFLPPLTIAADEMANVLDVFESGLGTLNRGTP